MLRIKKIEKNRLPALQSCQPRRNLLTYFVPYRHLFARNCLFYKACWRICNENRIQATHRRNFKDELNGVSFSFWWAALSALLSPQGWPMMRPKKVRFHHIGTSSHRQSVDRKRRLYQLSVQRIERRGNEIGAFQKRNYLISVWKLYFLQIIPTRVVSTLLQLNNFKFIL